MGPMELLNLEGLLPVLTTNAVGRMLLISEVSP